MKFKTNGKKGSEATSVLKVVTEEKNNLKKTLNKQKARIIVLK